MKSFLYIVASFLENAATAIFDRIDMNPHAEPELYISRECLDEMAAFEAHRRIHHLMFGEDNDRLCLMLARQEGKH